MEIEILSAKRSKKQFEVAYEREEDGQKTTVRELHHSPVHPDLTKKFNDLTVHFACLCDLITSGKNIDKIEEKDLENLKISSYSVGGKDQNQGIVLTGQKVLKNGKVLILNSPFTRFDEDEKTGYRWIDDLQSKLVALEDEIEQYLFQGKRAEEVQLKMELPEAVN